MTPLLLLTGSPWDTFAAIVRQQARCEESWLGAVSVSGCGDRCLSELPLQGGLWGGSCPGRWRRPGPRRPSGYNRALLVTAIIMGNAISGGSGDEDDPGMEQEESSTAAADTAGGAGGQHSAVQLGSPGGPSSPLLLPPSPGVLLEQARLREAAARLRDVGAPESVVSRHQSALLRWLEERLSRGEEALSREQFIEMMESRANGREECEEVRPCLHTLHKAWAYRARNLKGGGRTGKAA